MRSLALYRVLVGGAVYWMSLWADDLPLDVAAYRLLVAIGDDEQCVDRVEAMTGTETHEIYTWDPNTGEDRPVSVWYLHEHASKPTIHGCSEWP